MRFTRNQINYFIQAFESLGFVVELLEQENEQVYTTDESVKDRYHERYLYNEDPSLMGYYVSPIVVRSLSTNATYEILINKRSFKVATEGQWGGSELSDSIKKFYQLDSLGNLISRDFYKDTSKITLVEKGKKSIGDEEIDIEVYQSQNEFANFENFDDVTAPDYSAIYKDDPQLSVVHKPIDFNALTESQIKKAEEKLKIATQRWEEIKETEESELLDGMWTFDEIDSMYNTNCTDDDKRAYFIYLQNKTRKKLKGDWDKKYGSSYPAQAVDILGLMKRGALFYDPTANFGERLQPRVIYRSGNIWKKWGSLTNNQDEYIKRFGQEIYQTHIDTLKPIFEEMLRNRLSVRSDVKSMRLFLSPIHPMAKEIMISQIKSPKDITKIEKDFETYAGNQGGVIVIDPTLIKGQEIIPEKTFTQMINRLKNKHRVTDLENYQNKTEAELEEILKKEFYDYDFFESKKPADANFVIKKYLSLYDGFLRWLTEAGKGIESQEYGIQWSPITNDVQKLKNYYLSPLEKNPFSGEKNGVERWARTKNDAKKVGERLFAQFLDKGLILEDQDKVEYTWNATFNAYLEPKLEEVPIGFTYRKYLDGDSLFLLKESNLNALRYYLTRGSAGLAYGVGLGKTFCSIFVMKQALDLGLADRPLVIVPNQVYGQFKSEIFRALGNDFSEANPDSRINGFYNASVGVNETKANNAKDGINICTYQAVPYFQFTKEVIKERWMQEALEIVESAPELENDTITADFAKEYAPVLFNEDVDADSSTSTEEENVEEKSEDTIQNDEEEIDLGDFAKGGGINVLPKIFLNSTSTNYDMIVVDEAHNFNNLFEKVEMSVVADNQNNKKGKKKLGINRQKNPFSAIKETGGRESSSRAKKLWFLARYVQHINKMGNTILLSATPFTNSPLQVYSLMAIIDWDYLYQNDLGVIGDFFLNYAKTDYTEDFKTDLTIVRRTKLIGWNNVISLQKYVYRFFDKSTREQEDKSVERPNKYALPLKRIMIDNTIREFAKENFISTTIRMSDLQKELWARVREYAKPNGISKDELCNEKYQNTTFLGKYEPPKKKKNVDDNVDEVDIEDADELADGSEEGEKAKNSAKAIHCLTYGRQIAMNPYTYTCSGFKENPTPQQFVEQSPKLLYVMECIRSVKNWHESQTQPHLKKISGQVIYMDFKPISFPLIRDYLVSELGFDIDEIGIISGTSNLIGKKTYSDKQFVADAFMGRKKVGEEYVDVPDEKRIKVLIGSSSIKEGINLQRYGSVLYNCYLDFNPTDRIQVEGRIWRQGNIYKNVRIVTPLMEDCIDIFMFQKLEDKTERINQLWTRNGNLNELDTTSFDPAELKFELLTDPVAIAELETENKKEKINEEILEESELLNTYQGIERVWKNRESIITPYFGKSISSDIIFGLYYNINQIRPDLLPLPLCNKDAYLQYVKGLFKEAETYNIITSNETNSLIEKYSEYNPFYLFEFVSQSVINKLPYDNPYRLNSLTAGAKMWIKKLFNYDNEALINIMVQLLKEQKIAYPLGYSKNWRDLLPAIEPLIVDGDEVEFDTKKGRKKGIAELVRNERNDLIISTFYYHLAYQYRNNGNDISNIDETIKKLKIKSNLTNSFIQNDTFDDLDENSVKDLRLILKEFYVTNPNGILGSDSINKSFVPFKLDVDEFEDLNIIERNIEKVKSKKEVKNVEPTKYPEPFAYSSKERNANIVDINEYIKFVVFPKFKKEFERVQYSVNNSGEEANPARFNYWFFDKNEQTPIFSQSFSYLTFLLNFNYRQSKNYMANGIISYTEEELNNSVPNTWAELVDKWKSNSDDYTYSPSLFKTNYYDKVYSSSDAQTLADFKMIYESRIKPLGLENYTDATLLVANQKEKINSLVLQLTKFDDPEVFKEIVEEVIRKQKELNTDEIRGGSTFKKRAELFAGTNPDYLGNEMLGLINPKKDKKDKNSVKIVTPIVEEKEVIVEAKVAEPIVEEVEEVVVSNKSTQELIDELLMLSEFETDEAEKQKTIEIAEALKLTLMFE